MTVTEVSPSDVAARVLRARALTLALHAEGTRTVVILRGEADLFDLPVLSDALSRVIAMRTGDVVIDFAELDFVDVPTVRMLAVSQHLLDHHGRQLSFRSPSRLISRLLDLFGLSDLIEDRTRAQGSCQASG